MAEQSTSEMAEQYGDRSAVLARLPREWTLLNDTPWPGRSDAVLDHLAIGPTGVFALVVGEAPAEAVAAAEAVARLVPGLPRDYIHGVLVGADHPAPWVEVDGAILCESVDLARLLRSLPSLLTNEEVAGIVGVVHVGLERADRTRAAALRALSSPEPAPGPIPAAGTGLGQRMVTDLQAVTEVRRTLRLHRGRRPTHRAVGGAS